MKKYLFVLAIILTSFTKPNEPVDRLGVKGPLTFNKTKFNLAWTSKPTDSYYIQEYLPPNETSDHFIQMMSIFLLVSDLPLKDAVQQKIAELKEKQKTDPTCNYMASQSPDGKEYIVDFLLGESKNGKSDIQEFNIYRYRQVDAGNNKKAILVYAYSKKSIR